MWRLAMIVLGTIGAATAPAMLSAKKAALNMQPGQWQTVMKVEMAGLPPGSIPPITTTSCLTEKDVIPSTAQAEQNCTIKKQKIVGSTVEWEIECRGDAGETIQGTGKITYKGKSFDGSMQMKVHGGAAPDMQMSYTMRGKHTGPCKKK